MDWADQRKDSMTDPVEDFTWLYSHVVLDDAEFVEVTGVGKEKFAEWSAKIRERALEAGLIVLE